MNAASTPPPTGTAGTHDAPPRRVVVAGLGLISPLGHGAWPTFRALLDGATVADRLVALEPGTDPLPLTQAVGGVSVARQVAGDPACDLAERAAREAAAEANVGLAGLPAWLGTSKGAVTSWTRAADAWSRGGRKPVLPPDLAACVALGPHGFLAHQLGTRTGVSVRGHAVAACASGLVALDLAFGALRRSTTEPDVAPDTPADALVVSSESALLPAFVHSYRRLGVLAPTTADAYRARPLDERRGGFVLGEAGVAVLLRALPRGAVPGTGQIELLSTAVCTDPGHLIRSDARMAGLERVAQMIGSRLDRAPVALHPHAPGTIEHDAAEAAVLARVLGSSGTSLPAYAAKGALGHALGASGLVSLVVACLCARTARRPPMPWLERPLAVPGVAVEAAGGALPQGAHAVFAAGFGGHVAGAAVAAG